MKVLAGRRLLTQKLFLRFMSFALIMLHFFLAAVVNANGQESDRPLTCASSIDAEHMHK